MITLMAAGIVWIGFNYHVIPPLIRHYTQKRKQ